MPDSMTNNLMTLLDVVYQRKIKKTINQQIRVSRQNHEEKLDFQ